MFFWSGGSDLFICNFGRRGKIVYIGISSHPTEAEIIWELLLLLNLCGGWNGAHGIWRLFAAISVVDFIFIGSKLKFLAMAIGLL